MCFVKNTTIGFFCQAHGAREKARRFSFLLRYNLRLFTDTNSVICKMNVGAAIGRPLPQVVSTQADEQCSPLQNVCKKEIDI